MYKHSRRVICSNRLPKVSLAGLAFSELATLRGGFFISNDLKLFFDPLPALLFERQYTGTTAFLCDTKSTYLVRHVTFCDVDSTNFDLPTIISIYL